MLTIDQMRAPRADNPTPVKLFLSATAREALRRGRQHTGHDMSTLVDWLIQREYGHLSRDDPATEPELPLEEKPPAPQRDNYKRTSNDPDFEFDA